MDEIERLDEANWQTLRELRWAALSDPPDHRDVVGCSESVA